MENRATVIASAVAVLALMGAAAAWIYSHLQSLTVLQTKEQARHEWLERYLEAEEKRFQDIVDRVERIETMRLGECRADTKEGG